MRTWPVFIMAVLLTTACSEEVVQTDLTGIDLTVKYDYTLKLDQLRIRGIHDKRSVFGPSLVPDSPRELDDSEESVVILLTDLLGGETIRLRVDGLSEDQVAASVLEPVDLIARVLVEAEVRLGAPAICGDGIIQDHVEDCDDNNQAPGDGCNQLCLQDDEWKCDGEPSTCWRCGNEICDSDEDICLCPEDCTEPNCGDGLCCPASGENSCTCPSDCEGGGCGDRLCCVASGENTCNCEMDCGMEFCGNHVCCLTEGETAAVCEVDCATGCGDGACLGSENTCSCPEDCGDSTCGDGICCTQRDEDRCSCPEDCGGLSTCGDGLCCNQTGENGCSCEADCGEGNCGDGVCCEPDGENLCSCAVDCGEGTCGDDHCCAADGENEAECPLDCVITCGDSRCLFFEDVCNCPDDCDLVRCGDGSCCAAGGENRCTCPPDCGEGSCGDGVCCPADGENHCSCPNDCGEGYCGDSLCCTEAGEDVCTCPIDCGVGFCGDEACCPQANENSCNCTEDCGEGSCGDLVCCPAQDEDRCSCPGDCGPGSCGDGLCCPESGESPCNCQADCGEEFCGNGSCCAQADEDSCSCPQDCGAGECPDGICCAEYGEDTDTCPDDCSAVCPDGVCSASENPCSCPQDCGLTECGDSFCCPDNEDVCNCPDDCGPGICGDQLCCPGAGEETCSCPDDCGDGSCGDGICCPQTLEDTCSCVDDCGTLCGDGCCNGDEVYATCPDDCTECGNGVIETGEECDDGDTDPDDGCSASCTVEGTWICTGEPSCCALCGNDLAECQERCDGTDLQGETCLSLGYLDGTGLECTAVCDGFKVVGQRCGQSIDSWDRILLALEYAYGLDGHEVIGIQAGTYPATGSLVLDECGGSCTAGQPFGVTLKSTGGSVIFDGSGFGLAVIEVVTGRNRLQNLEFANSATAVHLLPGPDAGHNTLRNLLITNDVDPPAIPLRVDSDSNQVEANALYNDSGGPGENAIQVSGQGNTIAMNLVRGPFNSSVLIDGVAGPATRIDHNSIILEESHSSIGITLQDAQDICYRNNIVYGNGLDTTGFLLSGVTLASPADCGGIASGNNVNLNHQTACSGLPCAALCAGGAFCDRLDEPLFSGPELCLDPGSRLIDSGIDLGYDMNDFADVDYNGLAPEVGARESGILRVYGQVSSSCP